VHARSRYVTVLSEPAKELWTQCFGQSAPVLLVPGAAEDEIPAAGRDPYGSRDHIRCVFAGTVYGPRVQPEAHRTIIDKLNALGRALASRGGRLYMCGVGDVSRLDRKNVTYLGRIPYERTWDYFRYADVGCVVSAGTFMHNNESSKIYHYLRAGLPVVSESGFPNDYVVREAQCGVVVDHGTMQEFAEVVVEAAHARWDRDRAINYIRAHHTWSRRVKVYDDVLRRECD